MEHKAIMMARNVASQAKYEYEQARLDLETDPSPTPALVRRVRFLADEVTRAQRLANSAAREAGLGIPYEMAE